MGGMSLWGLVLGLRMFIRERMSLKEAVMCVVSIDFLGSVMRGM